jgi:hemerythrin superfamily protein
VVCPPAARGTTARKTDPEVLMNAIDLLIADHNRVRGLFSRFRTAKDAEAHTGMAEIAAQIFQELEVHTTIEEDVFYPAVHDVTEETGELVDEGVQEHHVVDLLMAELGETSVVDDEWTAKVIVLIENVEHHAEEEETELFPTLRSKMDAARLDELAEQLEARKAELGAPVLADKIDLTKDELVHLAQAQEIPGRSSMSQEELAATVAPR